MVRNCGNCKYFGGHGGYCVAGLIRKTNICDYHEFSRRAKEIEAQLKLSKELRERREKNDNE